VERAGRLPLKGLFSASWRALPANIRSAQVDFTIFIRLGARRRWECGQSGRCARTNLGEGEVWYAAFGEAKRLLLLARSSCERDNAD
jgi:hypothetical protein